MKEISGLKLTPKLREELESRSYNEGIEDAVQLVAGMDANCHCGNLDLSEVMVRVRKLRREVPE